MQSLYNAMFVVHRIHVIKAQFYKGMIENDHSCMGIRYAKLFEAAKSMFKS